MNETVMAAVLAFFAAHVFSHGAAPTQPQTTAKTAVAAPSVKADPPIAVRSTTGDCEGRTVATIGKAQTDATKLASIEKCEGTAKASVRCKGRATDKNGKTLESTAKFSLIKICAASELDG